MAHISLQKLNGVRTITLNNPKIKNAISNDMFLSLADTLNKDANDDEIVITIITGKGEYFTSGFNVSAKVESNEDPETMLDNAVLGFKTFILALINYPKILIALVNGPAVGVGVTMLGLCDVAYASESATFRTPFTKLGLCPEGCSSYLFPMIFGRSTATEMLLFERVLDAKEALQRGLISKIIPLNEFDKFYQSLLQYGSMSLETTKQNKALIMYNLKSILLKTNDEECRVLRHSFDSDDFARSIMEFMARKAKSKL